MSYVDGVLIGIAILLIIAIHAVSMSIVSKIMVRYQVEMMFSMLPEALKYAENEWLET